MIIVIDIGGSHIRIAKYASQQLGEVDKYRVETNYDLGLASLYQHIEGKIDVTNLEKINIALSGDVDTQVGVLKKFHHLSDWQNKPLVDDLQSHFQVPVKLENDAICGARGEAAFGQGKDLDAFIYLSWGSGIGGCLVKKNPAQFSYQNLEPGHQVVVWQGRPCGCGQWGCLETYTGGKQIEQFYGIKPRDLEDPAIWQDIRDKMTQALLSMRVLFNTDQFIFGGGFIAKDPQLLPQIETKINQSTTRFTPIHLKLSQFGESVNLYGAATL